MNLRSSRSLLGLAWLLAAGLAGMSTTRAQLSAVNFNTTAFGVGNGGNGVFGWWFTTFADLRIRDVGIFDFTDHQGIGDGLNAAHTLAIWDTANPSAPVSTTLIPAGTGTRLVGGFRYVPVASPTLLLKDHYYVVGAIYQSDDAEVSDYNPAPGLVVTLAPQIGFIAYSFTNEPGLVFPDQHEFGHYAMFGPNFTYTPVPEPSTLPFAVIGGLVLFAGRVLRARRPQPPVGSS